MRPTTTAPASTPAPAPEWIAEYRRELERELTFSEAGDYYTEGLKLALNLLDRLAPKEAERG